MFLTDNIFVYSVASNWLCEVHSLCLPQILLLVLSRFGVIIQSRLCSCIINCANLSEVIQVNHTECLLEPLSAITCRSLKLFTAVWLRMFLLHFSMVSFLSIRESLCCCCKNFVPEAMPVNFWPSLIMSNTSNGKHASCHICLYTGCQCTSFA